MSTKRKLSPIFSTNKSGAVIATVKDFEHFRNMEDACEHLRERQPQIVSVKSFPAQSSIEISFTLDVTQRDAATILDKISYIV